MAGVPDWYTDLAAVVLHPSESAAWTPAVAAGQGAVDADLRLGHDGSVWYGNAEDIVRLVGKPLGLERVLLRSTAFKVDREPRTIRLSLLLQAHPKVMPAHGRWSPVADLRDEAIDAANADLVAIAVREIELPLTGSRAPWYERGWFAQAMAWADASLAARGLERRGLAVQHRSWGLWNVVRLVTDGGIVYFKAAAFDGAVALGDHGDLRASSSRTRQACSPDCPSDSRSSCPACCRPIPITFGPWRRTLARC